MAVAEDSGVEIAWPDKPIAKAKTSVVMVFIDDYLCVSPLKPTALIL
jgi:hypothetical protein